MKNVKHYATRTQAKTYLQQVRGQEPTVDDYVRMLIKNNPRMAVELEETYEEYAQVFGKSTS